MSLRRGLARLAVLGGLLAGLLLSGPAPASADDDSVRVRAASSFTAGGLPGGVSVSVVRRSDGCVGVRAVLAVRLPGLTADQLQVQVYRSGAWRTLTVSAADRDVVTAAPVAPERSPLCEGKSASLRYRLAFQAGAPGGQATVVVAAYTGTGRLMDRDSDTARVVASRIPAPTPSATPSPEVTEPVEPVEAAEQPATSAPAVVATAPPDSGGGFFGLGAVVILLGLGMVGIGAALLFVLLRRNRAEQAAAGPHGAGTHPGAGHPASAYPGGAHPAGGGYPTGGGYPAASAPPYPGPAGPAPLTAPTARFPSVPGGGDATQMLPRIPPEDRPPFRV